MSKAYEKLKPRRYTVAVRREIAQTCSLSVEARSLEEAQELGAAIAAECDAWIDQEVICVSAKAKLVRAEEVVPLDGKEKVP